MTADELTPGTQQPNRHVLVGLGMIVLGGTLFLAQRIPWDINWWSSWWAIALFFLGLVRLFVPAEHESRRASRHLAAWLMTVGAWGFVSAAELFGLRYATSWPLLIVALGCHIAWEAMDPPDVPHKPPSREQS
jgi:hypothetical protein